MADRKNPPKADDWEDDPADWEEEAPPQPDETSVASAPYGPEDLPATAPQRLRGLGGRALPKDPGILRTIGSKMLQGFYKQGSDEAAGAITRLAVDPGVGWRQPDGSVQLLETPGDVYRAGRDAEREIQRGASEHHPKLSIASEMLGDIASDLTLQGLGLGGVGSAGYNTVTGAISGLMGSDTDLTPDKVTAGDAASAGMSTVLGGLLGRYVPEAAKWGLGKITPPAMRALRTFLENKAVSQGRRVLLSGADQLAQKRPTSPEAVLEALESKAIVPFGTTQGAFKRLERLSDDRGAVYGSILKELEESGVKGPDAEELAAQLAAEAETRLAVSGSDTAIPDLFTREAASVLDRPVGRSVGETRLGLNQAEGIKRTLQKQAKYGRIEDTPINEARQDVASLYRQAIEDVVQEAADAAPEGSTVQTLGDAFKPVKQRLARALEARQAAEKGAAAEAKRRGMSLTDYMMVGMGRTPGEGFGLAALNNFARNRGTSAVARGAYGLSRLARAGAQNPAAVNREIGAAAGRSAAPELAALLAEYFSSDEDPSQQALIERLRRKEDQQ